MGMPAYPQQYGSNPGGYGPPPGGGGSWNPPPPPPGGAKKSKLGLILGIVGGLLLLVVIGGGLLAWKLLGKKGQLPIEAKYLPGKTTEVSRRLVEASRETDEKVRRAYTASDLGSSMCTRSFSDPARRLEGIDNYGSRSAKEFFFKQKNVDEVQKIMECGSLLGSQLADPFQTSLAFDEDEKNKRSVGVMHVSVNELPGKYGFIPFNYDKMKGYCRPGSDLFGLSSDPKAPPKEPKQEDCKDYTQGAFKDPNSNAWFFGNKLALDALAPSIAKPREELTASVQALADASTAVEGMPFVNLKANPKSSKEFFLATCQWGASQSGGSSEDFMKGCFPATASERPIGDIDAKLRAAAYEIDTDYSKAGAIKGNIVFVARDADGATSVEKSAKEIVDEWHAHVDSNEAKLTKDTKDKAYTQRAKKFAAIVHVYLEALKKSKVSRSGRIVKISFSEPLSQEDKNELADADKSTLERRIAVAEILDAMQQKQRAPVASLTKLVGPTWAKYLAGPPPPETPPTPVAPVKVTLLISECEAIKKKVAKFKITDISTTESRAMYLDHKYANCVTKPPQILPEQRACLNSFNGAADYQKCAPPPAANPLTPATPPGEPPESEFGTKKK